MSAWKGFRTIFIRLPMANMRAADSLYQVEYADPQLPPDAFAADNIEGRSALQLAIWNVLYDDDFTITTTGGGAFHVSLLTYDPETQDRSFRLSTWRKSPARGDRHSRADGFLSTVDGFSHDALADTTLRG